MDKLLCSIILILSGASVHAQGVVSFIFDDNYKSHYDVVHPLFVEYGLAAGFAINSGTMKPNNQYALGLTHRRLGYMVAAGHEVINHGGKHRDLRSSGVAISTCQQEMTAAYDLLTTTKYSYTIHGWSAPYSAVAEHCVPVTAERHTYGFNVYNTETGSAAVMRPGIDPLRLWRTSLYNAGLAGAFATIDAVAESGGLVVFYDHDPSRSVYPKSMSISGIRQVIEYAISKGVQILPPTAAVSAALLETDSSSSEQEDEIVASCP
jgi:peptidoglycan/xylan/chitin deacetylase (PgdA/CDA1 family)